MDRTFYLRSYFVSLLTVRSSIHVPDRVVPEETRILFCRKGPFIIMYHTCLHLHHPVPSHSDQTKEEKTRGNGGGGVRRRRRGVGVAAQKLPHILPGQ